MLGARFSLKLVQRHTQARADACCWCAAWRGVISETMAQRQRDSDSDSDSETVRQQHSDSNIKSVT